MDETTTPPSPPPASNAPTVRQGCLLTTAGALLAFFGCFGVFGEGGNLLGIVFIIPGFVVMFWGIFKVTTVIWRAMSKPLDR
jgi:hypothetical protein